jgi:hypothetical protein
MYRRWENFDQPKEEQAPGKSIRQGSGPEKEDRPEKPAEGTVERPAVHILFGRPVTTQDYETPLNREWRFLRLEYF